MGDLRRVVEAIIERSGLITALEAEGTDEARGRIDNIREFLGVVDEFADTHTDEDALFEAPTISSGESGSPRPEVRTLRGDSLADFIEWVRLRTDLDAAGDDGNAVTLMTVHASKGLEFDCVFVAGMEESLFPRGSIQESASVEEERRLAYVAITRARQKYLYLTYASQRTIYGQTQVNPVSRFVHEIPPEVRSAVGVGSAGFAGTGWEKRGSRRRVSRVGRGGGRRPRVRPFERARCGRARASRPDALRFGVRCASGRARELFGGR